VTTFLVARKRGDDLMHTFFDPAPEWVEEVLAVTSGWEVGEIIEWEGTLSVAEWRAMRDYLEKKWAAE
jgi:hypothetical protein